eukprot:g10145.t1
MAESSKGDGAPQSPPGQDCLPPAGPEVSTSRLTQDSRDPQRQGQKPEEETAVSSRGADEAGNSTGTPRPEEVSTSSSTEASEVGSGSEQLPGASPSALAPAVDGPRSPSACTPDEPAEETVDGHASLPGTPSPEQALASPTTSSVQMPPCAPGEPTEDPAHGQASLSGASSPDQAPTSPTTSSMPSPPPTQGGSIRPLRWLGYWAGGGDITDLSQGQTFTTVHAALAYYAGVDLLGIL